MQRIATLRTISSSWIQRTLRPVTCRSWDSWTVLDNRSFSTEKQTTIAQEKISLKNDGSMLVRLTDSTGKHSICTDEPSAIGGTDSAPNPVEILLMSLAACETTTANLVGCKAVGIEIQGIEANLSCEWDTAGFTDPKLPSNIKSVKILINMYPFCSSGNYE